MKLRIIKYSNNQYGIEKRIFHIFKFEWWASYVYLTYNTFEQAKEKIDQIKKEKANKDNKDRECLRFDI